MDRRLLDPRDSAADRLATRLVEGIPVAAGRIEIAGVSTALLVGGTGPPVVLLHGHGGFAESLVDAIAGLVDGYRILAPDLPGLGRSELRGGQLGPASTTKWLGRLIAATCTAPPVVVGSSAGAGVAVRYVLSRGARVGRIVLVSPVWNRSAHLSLSLRAALVRFGRNPRRATADRVARHLLFDADLTRARRGSCFTAIEDYVIERSRHPEVLAANRALPLVIATAELARIDVPVAVICGRYDRISPIVGSQRVSAEHGWPLTLIDGAGHLPHLEQPRLFIAALRTAIDPPNQPTNTKEHQ